MKTTKSKITTLVIVSIMLAAAFFYGGDYASKNDGAPMISTGAVSSATAPVQAGQPEQPGHPGPSGQPVLPDQAALPGHETPLPGEAGANTDVIPSATGQEPPALDTKAVPAAVSAPEAPAVIAAEPGETAAASQECICTLSINCATILNNLESFDPAKTGLVPADGAILDAQTFSFNPGETVFDLLVRETKRNRIHLEFEYNPAYQTAYIEGIGNIYEFDCGELSGWTYKVNGSYPGYGCSLYELQSGDVVEVVYTCDLGRDVGGYIEGVHN